MEHVAIDWAVRESQVCIRGSDGTILAEERIPTGLIEQLLGERPKSRVIIETSSGSFAIADQARAKGHEVRVVPSSLVRVLGVGSRKTKNDRRDAQVLSEVSSRIDLPSVHIPSQRSRELKALCGMREELVESRTKLVNSVRGWLRANPKKKLRRGGVATFPKRVRETYGGELASFVERQLRSIEFLSKQIAEADTELKQISQDSPVCKRLMTVPGVGPVTSVRFVATVDKVERFGNANELESYLGLTPGEDSSGDRKRLTSITKAGSTKMRWALIQAAWSSRRSQRASPMVLWSAQIEKRRGRAVAIVALARKMAGVLYAIWRDGSTYEAQRAARQRSLTEIREEILSR